MSTTPDQITDLIGGYTDLKNYFEQARTEMQPFMAAVQHPNQVTLEVGTGKQFAHPVDAWLHIQNHVMANNIAWRMVIYPNVYEFPYKGYQNCHFQHSKQVEIVSSTNNAADVVWQSNTDHPGPWLIIADYNCYLTINHITFKDNRAMTKDRVIAISERNLVNNNAGGWVHGISGHFNSTLRVNSCRFANLWNAISIHDSSQAYIGECVGTNVVHGVGAQRTSYVSMNRCQWTGIGDTADTWRYGYGAGAHHSSVLHAHGNSISNFWTGVQAHWNADVHFNRIDDSSGTVNGSITNCYRGVDILNQSGGNFTYTTISNSLGHAFVTRHGSSVFAHDNVTIDGANYGFYCHHIASIVANYSTVKNCRGYGFHASYLAEIHASGTQAKVSGNAVNYSPGTSHTPGNFGGQIYIS